MSASADPRAFIQGLVRANARAREIAKLATDQFGENVLRQSKQMCPVATGFLQASGTAEPAVVEGSNVSKRLAYGANYAAAVHEIPDPPVHHEVGQWKFLEIPIRNNAPKYLPFVAGRLKAAL